jgi:hypothetical protein
VTGKTPLKDESYILNSIPFHRIFKKTSQQAPVPSDVTPWEYMQWFHQTLKRIQTLDERQTCTAFKPSVFQEHRFPYKQYKWYTFKQGLNANPKELCF